MSGFQIVLPCYNEEKSIEVILNRALAAAKKSGFTSENFKLVLVENGSKDESLKVMKLFKEKPEYCDWFEIVIVPVNQGYGFGILQGLKQTTSEFIGWSHADQQCAPEDYFKAFHDLQNSSQPKKTLVKGLRRGRSFQEKMVTRVFESLATVLLGQRFHEVNAQPKVFHRSLLDFCPSPPTDFAFDLYFLYQAMKKGFEIKSISVDFPARVHGLSNWASSLKSRRRHIENMIKYILKLKKESDIAK